MEGTVRRAITDGNLPKIKKEPKIKQKKLRSLIKTEKKIEKIETEENIPKSYKKTTIVITFVLVLTISLIVSNVSFSRCGFWATYENNFNKIVHGDERFCYRSLDSELISEKLEKQVVGQDDALKLIKGALNLANREKITQMAFSGGVGTGKTLASNIIMENFKWQRNVISTIFDINFQVNLTGQEAFDSDFNSLKNKFSECGFNLLVIDDVDVKPETIQRISKLERSLHRMVKQKLFKLVMIVIFNGEIKTDDLNHFVKIEFEKINEKTFHDCIKLHQKLKNVELKPSEIEELKMIDYNSTGCKTVAKKINLMTNS